jgi:hypothetical protein
VTATTTRLLDGLSVRGTPRTRQGEIDKARARWKLREARLAK